MTEQSAAATQSGSAAESDAICPACDSRANAPYLSHQGHDLFACADCGTVHLHPRPTPADVAVMYTDAYQNASTSYFAKVEKKLQRSRRRVAALARIKPAGRLLDIGCSGGFVVEAARKRGYDAYGLDIDPVSIAYARRHYPANTFVLSTTEDYAPSAPRFDVIYCSEVIEHLADPQRFVATVFDLLAPDGLFYLTTPDISHWRRPRDVRRWDGFCPPAHCVYFTPESLVGLLRRAGFERIHRQLAFKPGIKLTCRKPA